MLPDVDKEGFLRNRHEWSAEVAVDIAGQESIALGDDHWEVINLVQRYYEEFGIFPVNRVLVSKMKEDLGEDKGSSIHLMQLFSGKPMKVLAKIAGLPKPPNCD